MKKQLQWTIICSLLLTSQAPSIPATECENIHIPFNLRYEATALLSRIARITPTSPCTQALLDEYEAISEIYDTLESAYNDLMDQWDCLPEDMHHGELVITSVVSQ